MSKHTWEYNEEELSTGMSFDVYNEQGKRITEAYVTREEAQLIAAAPELLEALQNLVANCQGLFPAMPNLMQAKAAINKATGEL